MARSGFGLAEASAQDTQVHVHAGSRWELGRSPDAEAGSDRSRYRLQLASPALPVGAYTYSQGLEWAVEAGLVRDQATAAQWIGGLLEEGVGRFEAPLAGTAPTRGCPDGDA